MTTLLIVDDERTMRLVLGEAFRQRGYAVDVAASGDEALEMLTAVNYDTVLLDLQMPGLTGNQLLAMADDVAPDTAFVVLTAYASAETAITALRSGAVDYLRKPSSFEIIFAAIEKAKQRQQTLRTQRNAALMLAQIKKTLNGTVFQDAMLTTPSAASTEAYPVIEVGIIRINENGQTVFCRQLPVELTPVEYRVLHTLAKQPNTVLSYSELASQSHDTDMDEDEARTLLRTHIYRLRNKLSSQEITPIEIVRGRGVILHG